MACGKGMGRSARAIGMGWAISRGCVFLDGTFPAYLALVESSWNVHRIQRRIQRLGPIVAIQIGALCLLFVCFVYFAFSALFSSIVNSSNCSNTASAFHHHFEPSSSPRPFWTDTRLS
ncbi:uncharacterized protein AKAW2_20940S [Aspergillus luchuensis]|uniref:Uncharacterized protein n=2 Tax=Aspergillus subgen. Circumdati TaxID=2720871 RepID=A0A8G1VQM8_9EURO|nr:hypothetical protein BO85DRAFT_123080 [Aspergillus piperis CBS 112811]XP_041539766.1 uncharacterized protein AKAW2_20940S [Aspergillus luchuensis]RAH62001.1 hypothetical protein BO85DRAFT_123080 [Aspergillus piperis CBS 112811]BCR96000.1 hypothetical protein AKAW2_20940S [Aspergillus luchuensis]